MMPELKVLQTNFDNMKEQIRELKEDVKNIVPSMTKLLKDEYISKVEFEPYKKSNDKIRSILYTIASVILIAVLGSILALVIK